MMKRPHSAVAILLSLLLVLMPIQGAIAEVLFSDQVVDHSAHSFAATLYPHNAFGPLGVTSLFDTC